MKEINFRKFKINTLLIVLMFQTIVLHVNAQELWSLQQCIDTATIHNKNLQINRNLVSVNELKQKEAKGNLYPRINLSADYKYYIDLPYQFMPQSAFGGPEGLFKETQFGVPHNINATLQFQMPVYNPQINGAVQSSKIAGEMSLLQLRKTEEQVFTDVSNLYYNAQILQHQLMFTDSNLANTNKLLLNMQLLKQQLMVTSNDVNKIKIEKEQLQTRREMLVSNLEQILNALKFAMGISFERQISVEHQIDYEEKNGYLASTTPDIQIALTQNRLLKTELSTLKNSYLPTVSVFGSYGQTGFGYDEKPNNFLKFHPASFAGIQVAVPLFNGTVNRQKIKQKNIEIQNSLLNIQMVTDQNKMLVDNATRKKTVSQHTISNTTSQTELAGMVYRQTILQQQQGTASLTEVLMADNALRDAQQANLSAIVDYLKADLELKKITGNISLKK